MVDFKKYAEKRRLLEAKSPAGSNPYVAELENLNGVRAVFAKFSEIQSKSLQELRSSFEEIKDRATYIAQGTHDYTAQSGIEALSPHLRKIPEPKYSGADFNKSGVLNPNADLEAARKAYQAYRGRK